MAGTTIIICKKQHSVKIIRIGRDDEQVWQYYVWFGRLSLKRKFITSRLQHFYSKSMLAKYSHVQPSHKVKTSMYWQV
jgi:hypothetical protein